MVLVCKVSLMCALFTLWNCFERCIGGVWGINFVCVGRFPVPRLGGGHQTVWPTSWLDARVPFGDHYQPQSPTAQPVRCPQTYNSYSCSLRERESVRIWTEGRLRCAEQDESHSCMPQVPGDWAVVGEMPQRWISISELFWKACNNCCAV